MHITKDNEIKNVTKGAYKTYFEDTGWSPCDTRYQGVSDYVEKLSYKSDDEDPDFDTMSHKELLAFAKRHDISLGRVRQKDEIIDLLKQEYE